MSPNGQPGASEPGVPDATSPPAEPALLAALQVAGGIVVLTDAQRRITWCNAAFTVLTGWSLDAARGRSPGSLLQFDGTDPATVLAMREALKDGSGFRGVVQNRSASGRDYWLDLDIQPVRDAAGALQGFVSIQTDVTAWWRQHQYLHNIAHSAVAGFVVADEHQIIIDCNPGAEQIFEVPAMRLLGRATAAPAWLMVGEDGQPLAEERTPWYIAMATGEPVRGKLIGLTLSRRRRRWVKVSSERIPARDEGRWAVVSSFVDVTSRMVAIRELADERRRLNLALEGTRAGVWELNLQSWESIANEGAARVLGHAPGDSSQLTIYTFTRQIHREDLPGVKALLRAHTAGATDYFDACCRIRHRDGRWIWVELRGRVAGADVDGRPEWMRGTIVDVTAARQADAALREANAQLRGLFDLSPVAMSRSRMEDRVFLELNDAMIRLLGLNRASLGALNDGDLIPPDHQEQARINIRDLQTRGIFGPTELELLHADGHRVPVLLSGMVVNAADGSRHVWSIAQDLSVVKHMERRLRFEARTDRLTGLPNRALLIERLEECLARAVADPTLGFTLMFLDIDRFKLVNDTQGHDAGDQLLQLVADRLRRVLRQVDPRSRGGSLIARLGGDEFVVLLTEVRTTEQAERVAGRLLEALAVPCLVAHKEIHPSASLGIVLAGIDGGGAMDLLRDADMAMYEAKRRGRGGYALFDRGMLERLSRAVQLEAGLRHAANLQQLSLVYQPIVDLCTREMSSVEALIRWRHPELGMVSPAEFIPIAEESGLILPIGEWVLREACAQWQRWQQSAPAAAPATMSVNLSRVQMALGDQLLQLVGDVLAEYRMPHAALQLEVTEREVMRDPEAARRLMEGLRRLGVRLAMDDFGTGASSLGCLREYPFDVIKIDKSFIDDVGTSPAMLAVLHGTVMVIENLGMTSVAEGVEDALQVGVLQSLGCRFAQGYLFSRPVPAAQLLESIRALPVAA